MSDKTFSVVVVGQITLDDAVIFGEPATIKLDCPGGDGPYAVSGAYMWKNGRTGLCVRRGYDFDMRLITDVVGDSIDLSGVVEVDFEPNVHIWNMYDRKGHRYFINQRWAGREKYMAPAPADIPESYIKDSQALHIAAMPIFYEKQLIAAMPDNGTTDLIVQVDPHFDGCYRNENWDMWLELWKKITIFQPSEDELIRLFEIDPLEDPKDYVPYLKEITGYGPTVCTVKIGSRGVVVYSRETDEAYHVPPYDKAKIVDVTGCGDTFCGGFLNSYVMDGDIFNAAVRGSISSSFNIEHYGVLENFEIPYETVVARYEDFMSRLDREKCRLR